MPHPSSNLRPRYLDLLDRGELATRAAHAFDLYTPCRACPRYCDTDRNAGEPGICRLVGDTIPVAAFCDHHGEEPPIAGTRGSGTIFVGSCNLRCVFCQNWQISQPKHIPTMAALTPRQIADGMLDLQAQGCHNINFVSPSHVVAHIVVAICDAASRGLNIPIVYNTNGYDSLEALALLDGLIDIYLPDLKYSDDTHAKRLSKVDDYWPRAQDAVREMFRQVGLLQLDDDGIAQRGILIRHLVMPGAVAGTRDVLRFIARELSRDTHVALMAQFNPVNKTAFYPEINRPITRAEYDLALDTMLEFGLTNGFTQDVAEAKHTYTPDFDREAHPFQA